VHIAGEIIIKDVILSLQYLQILFLTPIPVLDSRQLQGTVILWGWVCVKKAN